MQFQQALVSAMETRKVTVEELAARTNSNPRWILSITTNCDWTPKLDTILRLCHALKFNVFSYLALAEVGSRGYTPNSQLPTPNSQLPTPNSQLPTPNSQLLKNDSSLTKHMEQILDLQPRHISLALKSFRLECGLSQRKLEKLTPFSVNTICTREGEHYQNYPTVTTLYSYCNAYHISLSEFVSRAFSFI